MAKLKPNAEEMRIKALAMLKKANELKLAEEQASKIKLGQLLLDYVAGKNSFDVFKTEVRSITGSELTLKEVKSGT